MSVTDRQTDGRTDRSLLAVARSNDPQQNCATDCYSVTVEWSLS